VDPGLVAVCQNMPPGDDAERERAVDEVGRSEERLRQVTQTVADAILTIDEGSRIRFVNRAAERTFGYREADLLGRPLTMLMPERFRQRHLAGLKRFIMTGTRTIVWDGTELVGRRRDGTEFPIEVAFAEGRDGDIRTFTGAIRDISARQGLNAQLLQAQRLESVGRLAGGIAHDFNNVLTAILGFARIVRDGLPAGDPQRLNMDQIEMAAERATGLVRQLLAFSRQQVLRPETVDLGAVVRDLMPMLRALLGEDVEIRVDAVDSQAFVEADRGQLEQVLVNLAANAGDAMGQGGLLTIEVGILDLDAEYAAAHQDVTPGPHVLLAVNDVGGGMDAETLTHIWEPFFTTKDSTRGTGLGLATVYGIVRQSGGHIWVYSEPDHGTTFRLYFPLVQGPTDAAQPPPPEPESARGTEAILVAEDEESLRRLIEIVLQRLGYRVVVAPDGATALEIAKDRSIDLLLTDVVMPGQSGLDLAAAVRLINRQVRVLFMSGYTAAALDHRGTIGQGDRLLEKPFTPAGLGRAVRRALDEPRDQSAG
jgi:two-component system cell cycle sensor histidine kinase/response regulator CckA